MANIETEIKLLLKKEDFSLLYRYLKNKGYESDLTRQVNYYFIRSINSPDLNLGSTRIRYLEGRYELTCKIPINDIKDKTIQRSYEYNADISRTEALYYIKHGLTVDTQRKLLGDMNQIHGIPMNDLYCYGNLRTGRFAFSIINELPPLLLDSNLYLGVFDYELEWELNRIETAYSLLQNLFKELDIQPISKAIPKVKRFFDRLKKLS